MHYHGPIVRPQTDADSIFVEVTVGCTHNNGPSFLRDITAIFSHKSNV